MQVAQNTVVAIRYILRNDAGTTIDASTEGEPLTYLHGNGNLIPGLERALEGKRVGDKLSVMVPPADAYGVVNDDLVQDVPRDAFQGVDQIEVGMQFQAQSNQGPTSVLVTKVTPDLITVDGNHPLAGQNLNFEVEIAEVRAATAEELEHGHVHGPGGHHHN